MDIHNYNYCSRTKIRTYYMEKHEKYPMYNPGMHKFQKILQFYKHIL